MRNTRGVPLTFPARPYCSFCGFMQGRWAWEPIDDGELAVSFVNRRQRSRGSVLVAPRRHVEALDQLGPAEVRAFGALVHRTAASLERALRPDGLHLWWGAGELAGQSEPHLHAQLVPRYAEVAYSFAPSLDLDVADRGERLDLARALRDTGTQPPEDN